MYLKKLKNNQSGFGLTELMATISIIGIVGTVSAAKLDNALVAARDANRMMNIHQVQTALNIYYDDNLSYPVYQKSEQPSSDGYKYLESYLLNSENQYISELPIDPLNKDEYVYKYWSDGQKFEISYGLEDAKEEKTQIAMGM
ncbi:MAG: prepilin-type N-terminal cleavage/methylation domain-containing protein [bacterium]